MNPDRLDPRDDLVFKLLLSSSEDILIALLSAVLEPPRPIRRAVVQDPALPRDFADDKGPILDVHVLLDDGTRVDIEMQCTRVPRFRGRALYFWAQLFAMQLEAGHAYDRLSKVVSILFLDYREFWFHQVHEVFRLVGQRTGTEFTELQEIHTIELPKLGSGAATDRLGRWVRFFTSKDAAELRLLAEKDPMIHKAEDKLLELSADARVREQLRQRQGNAMAQKLAMNGAFYEGLAEGRQEGQRQVLGRLLEAKFGALDEQAQERLADASETELAQWSARLLVATSLAELFAEE